MTSIRSSGAPTISSCWGTSLQATMSDFLGSERSTEVTSRSAQQMPRQRLNADATAAAYNQQTEPLAEYMGSPDGKLSWPGHSSTQWIRSPPGRQRS